MKRYLMVLFIVIPLQMAAQDIWKEGTEWVVTYAEGDVHTFSLNGQVEIEGSTYLTLTDTDEDKTVGYIRAERGDTVVYARGIINGNITEEFQLYDFGSFEPGTSFSYAFYDYHNDEIRTYYQEINADSVVYIHDVLEDGDIFPCCYNMIFKVGFIGGPMDLFYNIEDDPEEVPFDIDSSKPRTRNVSHMVFRPKSRKSTTIIPTAISPVLSKEINIAGIYNIQGQIVHAPYSGIYIQNGKKMINTHK